jgi:hypothetical protein
MPVLFVVFACSYQDHLEVVDLVGNTKHRPLDLACVDVELPGNGNAVLVASDGVPHQHLLPLVGEE